MNPIEIELEDQTAAWVHAEAARRNMSPSQIIAEVLFRHMRRSNGYDDAMVRFLSRKPVVLKRPSDTYPTRD